MAKQKQTQVAGDQDLQADADEPIKTVQMIRPEDRAAGGPVIADVHPDEVENWKVHGWMIKE